MERLTLKDIRKGSSNRAWVSFGIPVSSGICGITVLSSVFAASFFDLKLNALTFLLGIGLALAITCLYIFDFVGRISKKMHISYLNELIEDSRAKVSVMYEYKKRMSESMSSIFGDIESKMIQNFKDINKELKKNKEEGIRYGEESIQEIREDKKKHEERVKRYTKEVLGEEYLGFFDDPEYLRICNEINSYIQDTIDRILDLISDINREKEKVEKTREAVVEMINRDRKQAISKYSREIQKRIDDQLRLEREAKEFLKNNY